MADVKRRILCVEDNDDQCELVAAMLSDYQVIAARNASQGLLLAHQELFDLYLLDNWLPDFSGAELCRKIRKFDRNTPLLFLSAAAYEEDRQETLEAGAQAYLTKPVEVGRLQATVAELIHQAEMRSLDAKVVELSAIRDGIVECLAHAEYLLTDCKERVDKFHLKQKAYQAFIAAGGTRIGFERLWLDAFHNAFFNKPTSQQ